MLIDPNGSSISINIAWDSSWYVENVKGGGIVLYLYALGRCIFIHARGVSITVRSIAMTFGTCIHVPPQDKVLVIL